MFRNWLLTYNNPPDDHQEVLEALHKTVKAKYTIGQLEKGEETGTVHLQIAMNFAIGVKPGRFKKIPVHATGVQRDNGIFDYASKEKTRIDGPWEFGERPVRRSSKTDWN